MEDKRQFVNEVFDKCDIKLGDVYNILAEAQINFDHDTEEYKNMQHLLMLVDIILGSCELRSAGVHDRQEDLEKVKQLINNLEVAE